MKANSYLNTERQEAERLNISHRHLVNLRNRRLVPHLRLGGAIRYRPSDVDKALEKLTVKEIA
jgi:hypothetical protein